MLEIAIPIDEGFDEETSRFIAYSSVKVKLEHSLVSASKWESIWKKPFLGEKDKTVEETISYVKCMILNDELSPDILTKIITHHLDKIKDYISDEMTATKLHSDPNAPASRETITTELIYYWMISLGIPVEFQHWHLNRLITLIRTVNFKNTPPKNMTPQERGKLNRERLAQYKTSG